MIDLKELKRVSRIRLRHEMADPIAVADELSNVPTQLPAGIAVVFAGVCCASGSQWHLQALHSAHRARGTALDAQSMPGYRAANTGRGGSAQRGRGVIRG